MNPWRNHSMSKTDMMRDALKIPHASDTLIEWAKNHREVASLLVDFAESRIQDADEWNEKVDSKNAMSDGERERLSILGPYEAPRDALSIAEKLDSKSPKIQRLLARTELVRAETPGHFSSAYKKVSSIIESLLDDNTQDVVEVFFARAFAAKLHSAGPNKSERIEPSTKKP